MTEYTYNVVSAVWFGTTGIVRVRPEFGDDKFYIGTGHGHDAEKDEQHIAEWGLPFHPKNLETFFDLSK
jgi:hypothetical protein